MSEHIICSICYEDLHGVIDDHEEVKHAVSMTSCGHCYHKTCIDDSHYFAVNNGSPHDIFFCPLCRSEHLVDTSGPPYQRAFFTIEVREPPEVVEENLPAEISAAGLARAITNARNLDRFPPASINAKAASVFRMAAEAKELGRDLPLLTRDYITEWNESPSIEAATQVMTDIGWEFMEKLDRVLYATQCWKADAVLAQRAEPLEQSVNAAIRCLTAIRTNMHNHNQTCEQYRDNSAQVREVSAQNATLEANVRLLRIALHQLEETAQIYQNDCHETEKELRQTKALLGIARRDCTRMQADLHSARTHESALEIRIMSANQSLKALQRATHETYHARSKLESEVKDKTRALSKREEETAGMRRKIHKQQAEIHFLMGVRMDGPPYLQRSPPSRPVRRSSKLETESTTPTHEQPTILRMNTPDDLTTWLREFPPMQRPPAHSSASRDLHAGPMRPRSGQRVATSQSSHLLAPTGQFHTGQIVLLGGRGILLSGKENAAHTTNQTAKSTIPIPGPPHNGLRPLMLTRSVAPPPPSKTSAHLIERKRRREEMDAVDTRSLAHIHPDRMGAVGKKMRR